MDPNALRTHLAELHRELAETTKVDAASNSLLAELMQDIKRLIDQPVADDVPASGLTGEPRSLPDRLERVAVQFEADHPTLAASSRRLIDLLGKVGV